MEKTIAASPRPVALDELTYRHIAKMFVQALPHTDDDLNERIEQYLTVIKAMPGPARFALRAAYIFGSKAPREEREDLFSDLVLKLLQAQADNERLAYSIARCDWLDWWRDYKRTRGYITTSLESVTQDEDGHQVTLGSLLVGECEFEIKMDGELDAERLFDRLPDWARRLVERRLTGQKTSPSECRLLTKWASDHAMMLACIM